MATGRPKIPFNQDIADMILARIATTEKGVERICIDLGAEYDEKLEWFPSPSTVWQWLNDNPVFRQDYAHAKEMQADVLFDQMIEIADQDRVCVEETVAETKDGTFTKTVRKDNTTRSQMKVDARKWVLAHLKPKKYGDKLDVDHSVAFQLINDAIPRPERAK
jgi:hypothetical protein